jgi:hypothetical protein
MVPLLAAASAISAVSDIASSAGAAVQSLTSSGHAAAKPQTSFADLLAAHGVPADATHGAAGVAGAAHAVSQLVSQLA